MGGTGVIPSCNCNRLAFGPLASPTNYLDLTYQPCNGEQIQTIRYTSNIADTFVCIAERNYNFSGPGTLSYANLDKPCLQANCQSCDCYEFFYRTSVDPYPHYISYVPCNQPSSSNVLIGPLAPLTTGSFICSFPWTVTSVSGSLDYGPSGVSKQVNSGSCQQIVSGTLQPGDLRGGGMVMYVTGSYPNQNGMIMATASVGANRWGFYGTITGINNQAYGVGASNTQALRNYTPATASIAANTISQSINGYNDWFLPSQAEAFSSSYNWIEWPVTWMGTPTINGQPLITINTGGNNVLTSTEKYDGTAAQRRIFARSVPVSPGYAFVDTDKNSTVALYAFRYFTSSLVL